MEGRCEPCIKREARGTGSSGRNIGGTLHNVGGDSTEPVLVNHRSCNAVFPLLIALGGNGGDGAGQARGGGPIRKNDINADLRFAQYPRNASHYFKLAPCAVSADSARAQEFYCMVGVPSEDKGNLPVN